MKWVEKIRLMAAKRVNSSKKDEYRFREVKNLNEVRSIGILYDATDREVYEYVNAYVKRMKEELKKVHALGFINSKDDRDMLQSKLDFDFYNLKSLNFYLYPNEGVVTNFMNKKFDLLIDLNVENIYPLKIVAEGSKAAFKVGLQGEEDDHLDLVFNVEKEIAPEIESAEQARERILNNINQLIRNIKNYLREI